MDENLNVTQNENPAEIVEDAAMDPLALLQQVNDEEAAPAVEEVHQETAVERALREKAEKGAGSGMVVANDQLTDSDNKQIRDITDTDETKAGVEDALREMDAMIEVAQNLEKGAIAPPTNAAEHAAMMIKIAEASDKVLSGQSTAAEAAASISTKLTSTTEDPVEPDPNREPEEVVEGVTPAVDASLVNIIIDKTGLGANLDLSEEDREKIERAQKIKITEVESVELQTARFHKPESSFQSMIQKYQLSSTVTPVTLAASRYKVSLSGLTFGELGDISLDTANMTYDQLNKKVSIIYNKIVNTNIEFKDYEDFLKNTAFMDLDMLTFGLLCSTLSETDSITLECHRENCKKEFNANYTPRALIRWDKCSNDLLEVIEKTATINDPEEALKYHKESTLCTVQKFKLESGAVVTIGMASMYDYLHGICDLIMGDNFTKKFPEDTNGVYVRASWLLTIVRGIAVKRNDGDGYDEYTECEDIVRALAHLNPEEFATLLQLLAKFGETYDITFGIPDVVCPHCGAKTPMVRLDISDLVFRKFQMLGSTEIDLSGIRVI